MPAPDDPANLTYRSIELIGRELKNMSGRGRGEQPLPRRRRHPGGSGTGSGGDTTLQFGVATSDISAATDDPTADWGDGMFKPIDWDGVVATDEIAIKNRFRGTVDSGVHFWWMNSPTGDPILVVPDCL